MRDPKRIKPMLKLIEKIWTKNPDLRLGQLIGNILEDRCPELYYIEDDKLRFRICNCYLGTGGKK